MIHKMLPLFICVILAAAAHTAIAGSAPRTGISGSFHDISYLGATIGSYQQDDYQRVCIFCHTPHNAQPATSGINVPLWSHDISTVNLTPYVWTAPDNLPIAFNADRLVGPSRLCMSCHDGVTAVDSHGPTQGSSRGANNGSSLLTSTGRYIDNLAITHPIGFLYQDALDARGNNEIVDPNNFFIDRVPSGALAASSNTAPALRAGSGFTYTNKKIKDTLYGGYLTCASCHDVHNTNNSANDPSVTNPAHTPNYFVWAREQNSALCLSCHVK